MVRISVFQILMGGIGKNMESAEDDMDFIDGSVKYLKSKSGLCGSLKNCAWVHFELYQKKLCSTM